MQRHRREPISLNWTLLLVACVILDEQPLVTATAAVCWTSHSIVEYMLCNRIADTLPCKANQLSVDTPRGPVTCGNDVSPADLAQIPTIRSPSVVALTQSALFVLIIVDPDAPSRDTPTSRYWNHGIYADITAQDMQAGWDDTSASGMPVTGYSPPNPPPGSGSHRYQLFLFQQSTVTNGQQMTGHTLPPALGQFNLQAFVNGNNLCSVGSLIGAFQFTCENP
ncbi:Phosphatidylethanolamine-binding protein 4 [Lamellibrachia satsuma]|nr:Phosphatidylethanolamine-binding protein 4 [Lamellibrachia satsuma]